MNEKEYREKIEEIYPALFRIALGILRSDQDAADCLQEAVFRGWIKRTQLKNPESFRAWMTRITLSEARNLQRKAARQRKTLPVPERTPITPLRAALHRLAEEGLIEISPNRGAVVMGIGKEELVDIYKIRMRLEGLASAEAAKKISAEDKKRLKEIVELSDFYIAKQDSERLKELDTEFHSIIYQAGGNRMLCKVLSDLHKNVHIYRKRSLTVVDRLEKSVSEHKMILAAIEHGDADAADRLTSSHIEAALNNLLTVADK